jgi:hypothetical protein
MKLARVALGAATGLVLTACGVRTPPPQPPAPRDTLPPIGFSIQVGAFRDSDNAVRLSEALRSRGVEAFHFVASDGLHKVRFGSFPSRALAEQRGEVLRRERVIDRYYVVRPDPGRARAPDLRHHVVDSAMGFLGSPYRWGGPSAEAGFDCSGLTMTAYRLNGLELPRTSAAQFQAGRSVPRGSLKEADLVFFGTGRTGRVSHVGLYIGEGRFIHAPGSGKVVRIDELSESYYERHFLGARTYVR